MISLFLLSALFQNDPLQTLHYLDLKLELEGTQIKVLPLVRSLETLDVGGGAIPKHQRDIHNMNLDGPIRQVASIVKSFDQERQTVFGKPLSKPYEIAYFEVDQSLKMPHGSNISRKSFTVKIGLLKEPGKAYIRYRKKVYPFDVASLNRGEGYEHFLRKIVMPEDQLVHTTSDIRPRFLADLYFLGPFFSKDVQERRRKIGLTHMVLTRNHHFRKVKTHLASALCRKGGGKLKVSPSAYLRFYGDTLNAFTKISARLAETGATPDMIPELEAYLGRSPTDVRALMALIDALVADDRLTDAYSTLKQYRGFFRKAEHLEFAKKIEDLWLAHRYVLMEQRGQFAQSDKIKLEILSPKENDTLGGRHTVRFDVTHPDSYFLCADLFVNNRKVDSISQPPYEIAMELARKPRLQTLRLVTYFEDRTAKQEEVDIKVLPIDDEEEVNLARLRAVVTKGPKKFVTNLKREDFELHQMNIQRNIEHFRTDKAPLRVAILMDTSQSMTGKKLSRVQFAVRNFLGNLGPEDKVALYTFDQKVLRLSDFSSQYRHLLPRLFTLSPMLATSLYDAMYTAHRDLEKQDGNKVMIVLSDGADSQSVTGESDIREIFSQSQILLYPILLFNNYLEKEALTKSQFLHQMARMTGSVVYEVENANDLNSSFERIYDELKSFYYMDFYSLQRTPDPSKIRLTARGSNTQVRFHIFDDSKPIETWATGSLRR